MRLIARLFTALILGLWLTTGLGAQALSDADLLRWDGLAGRADTALNDPDATEEELNAFRTQITEFRADFDAARGANSARIDTLREQLAALNATSAGEGVEESPEFIAKRKELNDDLSLALAPVQRAEAEFVRAEALVTAIDQKLRDRQTEALLEVVPSPLNPIHWNPALADLRAALLGLWNENSAARAATGNSALRSALPVTIVLTLLGLVLIFRGRQWSRRIVTRLQRFGARGFGIWRFIVSLLRIALPFAGLMLIALAAVSTQMFGPKGNEILISIAILGGILRGVRWGSERVFSRDDDEALILFATQTRARLRFYVAAITLLTALNSLVYMVLEAGGAADVSKAVFAFPFTVISALALYRIGVILRSYRDPEPNEEGSEIRASTLGRVVRWLGTGAVLTAVVSPLLLAAGYFQATGALFGPYVMTLALLGMVMALQRFAADVYGAITGQGDSARDALIPVLVGFFLLVLLDLRL